MFGNPTARTEAEVSLRFLDTDTPNLKDAAFAFKRIEEEVVGRRIACKGRHHHAAKPRRCTRH